MLLPFYPTDVAFYLAQNVAGIVDGANAEKNVEGGSHFSLLTPASSRFRSLAMP